MRSAAPRFLSEENMGRDIAGREEEGQSQQRRAAAAVPASQPACQPVPARRENNIQSAAAQSSSATQTDPERTFLNFSEIKKVAFPSPPALLQLLFVLALLRGLVVHVCGITLVRKTFLQKIIRIKTESQKSH